MPNNPNVAFVSKVEGEQVQFYFNPVHSTYTAIWGDPYHAGWGLILKKDDKGNWYEVNKTLDSRTEQILDSQIKRYEEAKIRMKK